MVDNCLFCGIINGSVPSLRVYEGKHVIGVLSIKPASRGHVILIPREHQAYIHTINNEALFELMSAAKSITMLLSQALNPTGFNIINNMGAGAGQRIPHACLEVIPRYEGDGIKLDLPQKEFNEQELIELQKKILTISKDNTIKTLKAITEGKVNASPEVKAEAERALRQLEGTDEAPKKKLDDLL
ncbi:MAG: HIT family protein [Candidatus Nanoarchaeia archaeon]|jgi:histidine triad (HIT) family protein